MRPLARVDLFALPANAARRASFRGRDNYSLSDKRVCLRLGPGEEAAFEFVLPADGPAPGQAEVCLAASPEVLDSHAYARKFLNSVVAVELNGRAVHDGLLHWRSHEETAAYWPWFNFPFDAALLRPGVNRLTLRNRTTRQTLGEFFDPQLLEHFSQDEAVRKLATIYVSDLEVVHVAPPRVFPRLSGMPASAVAGEAFVVELSTGGEAAEVVARGAENARVTALGSRLEFDEHRALFEVVAPDPGRPCRVAFAAMGQAFEASVDRVYAHRDPQELVALPGMESTYWHNVQPHVRDAFERQWGTGVRISIDDFLNNLHVVPLEEWRRLIAYLVRRRRHYQLQRLRVPHYTRIAHEELTALADMGGDRFAGVAVPEPIHGLYNDPEPDLAKRQANYQAYFAKRMAETRLPGHKLVTFDSAGAMAGHYYRAGLDVHIAEIGPACNVLEEACCRGAAEAYGKPWGVAAAMHWYFGQGAHYAWDEARLRLVWQTMLSSYLAGARYVVWEGGIFDNLPVYNFVLTEESWRDYYRRYDHPLLAQARDRFGHLVDYHHAQQLRAPRVRFGVLRGVNDPFHGAFDAKTSKYGDLSIARAWALLSVFLPHVSFGRHGIDQGRPHRRWYSATPLGQVDVLPAEADQPHFDKYSLLTLLGWNTMTDELHAKLLAFVRGGGVLFLSLPHLCVDTVQKLEWTFYRGGDLTELCGVRVRDLGGRIERVDFATAQFDAHLPRRFTLTPRNPLLTQEDDELYPVFSFDTAHLGADLAVEGAEVLATSQRGEPVLLRRRVGKGAVYLLNSWCHPGRGRMQDLARGVMRTLAEAVEAPLRLEDPAQVMSWFEHPLPGTPCTRHYFLNTDWTHDDHPAQAAALIGAQRIAFAARPGRPVLLASDGRVHLITDDPGLQITSWSVAGDAVEVTTLGPGELRRVGADDADVGGAGRRVAVRVNGRALD